MRAFDTEWSPIFDDSGAIVGALQTLTEVTERQRIEAALTSRLPSPEK